MAEQETFYTFLFPWFGWSGVPNYFDKTLTEELVGKNVYSHPVLNGDWINYDIYRNKPVPPAGEYLLPEHLFCVSSNIKQMTSDIHLVGYFWKYFVSEKLLCFLKDNNCLLGEFDFCPISFVSKKQVSIATQKYFFLRFFKFYDAYLDADKCVSVQDNSMTFTQTFLKSLVFKASIQPPSIFVLKDFGFNCFIFNEELKNMFAKLDLNGAAIVKIDEYVDEELFRRKHPYPTKEILQERDSFFFKIRA
jgi:hypothetical protein